MARWMVGLWAVALVLGSWSGVSDAQLRQEELAPDGTIRARGTVHGDRTQQAAGGMTWLEPGPGGLRYETSAAVWMGLKDARDATCFWFDVERTESETTVTAYCQGNDGKGKAWGDFEVETIVRDGQFGEGGDVCQKRQNLKRTPVFTCAVRNPESDVEPEELSR